MADPPTTYTLVFRPLPSDVPAILRVRRLLKHALRSLDLRCVSASDVPQVRENESETRAFDASVTRAVGQPTPIESEPRPRQTR